MTNTKAKERHFLDPWQGHSQLWMQEEVLNWGRYSIIWVLLPSVCRWGIWFQRGWTNYANHTESKAWRWDSSPVLLGTKKSYFPSWFWFLMRTLWILTSGGHWNLFRHLFMWSSDEDKLTAKFKIHLPIIYWPYWVSLLHKDILWLWWAGATLSLWWLLLLQSVGSRVCGLQ